MIGITSTLLKGLHRNLNTRTFNSLVPKVWFTGNVYPMRCQKNQYGRSTLGIFGHLMSFITMVFTICTILQNRTTAQAYVWQLQQPNSLLVPSRIKASRLNVVRVLPILTPLLSMIPKAECVISIGVQTRRLFRFRNSPQTG